MVILIREGLAGSEGGWDETKARRRDCLGAGISISADRARISTPPLPLSS